MKNFGPTKHPQEKIVDPRDKIPIGKNFKPTKIHMRKGFKPVKARWHETLKTQDSTIPTKRKIETEKKIGQGQRLPTAWPTSSSALRHSDILRHR